MIPGIATAQIQKFTNGGKVSDDDNNNVEQCFVTLNHCVHALMSLIKGTNFCSAWHSSNVSVCCHIASSFNPLLLHSGKEDHTGSLSLVFDGERQENLWNWCTLPCQGKNLYKKTYNYKQYAQKSWCFNILLFLFHRGLKTSNEEPPSNNWNVHFVQPSIKMLSLNYHFACCFHFFVFTFL